MEKKSVTWEEGHGFIRDGIYEFREVCIGGRYQDLVEK